MKRIAIYILALATALLVPLEGTDVGKLQPVGVVQLYREDEQVIIVTDTGDSGIGKNVKEAFENLEETTAGVIFLDTADFLLLGDHGPEEIGALRSYLKPSVRVCLADESIEPGQAAPYLAVHRPATVLRHYHGQERPERLVQENGRLKLENKDK